MKWVVPVVLGFFLLAFLGFFVLARGISSRANEQYGSYVGSAPSSVYGGPVPYGTGPEWDKFKEAEKKGASGYAAMQGLMLSPEPDVALYASHHLADSGLVDAFKLLYDQLPSVTPYVKDSFRTGSFTDDVYMDAAKTVVNKSGTQRDGALLFLKLPYSPTAYSPGLGDRVLTILVEAVPTAEGQFAKDLAYAIGQYPSSNPQPLVDLLKDKSATARVTALTALGKLAREETLDEVKKLKTDSSSKVRTAAVTAEASINSAVASRAASSAYVINETGGETPAEKAAREKARNRLGMP